MCVVGTHYKHLIKALLISTHNIIFYGELRKISIFLVEKNVLIGVQTLEAGVLYVVTQVSWLVSLLSLSMLGKIFSRRQLEIFFLFFTGYRH